LQQVAAHRDDQMRGLHRQFGLVIAILSIAIGQWAFP
jgi:hypothetical protein